MNKSKLQLILIGIVCLTQVVFGKVFQSEVKDLSSALQSGSQEDINWTINKLEEKLTPYEIADASPSNNLSPDRLQHRNEVWESLEPIKNQFLDYTIKSQGVFRSNALSFLTHFRPDQQVYSVLHKIVQDATGVNATSSTIAYDLLFRMGLATPEIKHEVLEKMGKFEDAAFKEEAYDLIAHAVDWKLKEMLPICIDILQKENDVTYKRAAAEVLRGLGKDAANALPELKKQLKLLQDNHADFRDINVFKRTIAVIEAALK